jgi:CheY-like chemotaxis protein
MGYIVMAQEWQERQGDAALGRYLERARGSAQRARDLIQQMLTFSRGQHGEPRPLALTPLVEESVALLKSTLPSSVEFTIRSEGELPEVMVDPVHIEQVLMNLCINARDAMKGSGRLDLTLHRRETEQGCVCSSCRRPVTGSFVELAVRDNGPGIDPAVLDRMFEPFYSTKEVGKGSGMGLSTVHGIVHDWGGHVVVDTGIGAGSAFRVLIPALVDAGEAAEDTGSEAGAAQSASARQLRGKVLLVEDDPTVREFMADRLGSWGLEVTESPDAREALGYFMDSESPFGLVVLDQTMPKMTGTEFAARLLERFPEMPVILYTGYSDNVSETEVKGLGIRALVRKPIDDGAFFELLKEHLPALTD